MVNKNVLFIGTTYAGIFRSTDYGQSWTSANFGINGTRVFDLAGNEKLVFASCYEAGVFVSVDNGKNWSEFNSGLKNTVIFSIAIKGDLIFACSPGIGIFRSSVNKPSWVNVNSSLPIGNTKYLVEFGGKLFSLNYKGLFVSNDNGESWTLIEGSPVGSDAICVFAKCENRLYVGGNAGLFYYNQESNTLSKASSGPANDSISSLTGDGNVLFAGTKKNGCYVSLDKGLRWQKTALPYVTKSNFASSGYDTIPVANLSLNKSIVVASLSGPDMFTPNGGCYFSVDTGKTWTPIGPDTSWHNSVTDLLIRGDTLLAGSYNRSVWMRTLPKVSESAIGSSKAGLNPNPQVSLQLSRRASSGLCVTYTLPQPADVSVSIHTLNGSRVASLVNKTQPAGLYNYTWSFGKTPGLYIVRLKTGAQMLSRTIMFTP